MDDLFDGLRGSGLTPVLIDEKTNFDSPFFKALAKKLRTDSSNFNERGEDGNDSESRKHKADNSGNKDG